MANETFDEAPVKKRRKSPGSGRGRGMSLENLYFHDFRKNAISAARDFHYGNEVIEQIKKAKTTDEISGIMQRARHKKFKED